MTNRFTILGDPHLGRTFINNVPLHRRGDREKMVWASFYKSFENLETPYHVCIGDLFDKSHVPYSVILEASRVYREAAKNYAYKHFIILKGNHDWTRDLTGVSAFDVFAELVTEEKNIHVVDTFHIIDDILFLAWHPTHNLNHYEIKQNRFNVAFTHADVTDYGNDNVNLIPTKKLAELGVKTIYNGHIHKPETFDRDGVTVIGTGSMQPYAHGEQINDDLYVSLTLAELETTKLDLTNRCVRVTLSQGEELTNAVECLQLVVKRLGDSSDVVADVELGGLDMELVFKEALTGAGASPDIQNKLFALYEERKSNGV